MTEPNAAPRPAPGAEPPIRYAGLRTAGIGFGAGLLNGLLGIGGGILLVPGLIFLRNVHARVAVATSLGTVLCLSSTALAVHLAISGLYFSTLGSVLLLAAGALGSQAGTFLLNRVPQRWVLYTFAAFTFVSSTHLILQGLELYAGATGPAVAPPLWSFVAIGALAGLFSGMLGIGGGGVVVLTFSVLFHTPILGGIPLALAINIGNAGSSLIAQRKTGQTRWREVAQLVPAALLGIGAGVLLAVSMPVGTLKVLFAVFFLYMGTRLIARGRKS
jgi:hypothetical protein